MNDTQSLRYAKEETSTTLCADDVVVKSLDNIGGPCLDPRISLSSKADKNESDQDLRGQLNELSFHDRNSEKSFKNDEYIYVSIIFSSPTGSPKPHYHLYYRLNLKEINGIQSIFPDVKNGPSLL